ncbi:hypothetical protein QOZ84_04635 [Romboutsia sedimentorum]|uniref:Uncharacterized protein n=1 Tax=Romboutsia sedimentorum TaxID=1368474 RepID=A0ABT7E7H2_9FIRM|nr:hypothetical protein [Romboutsia sedimentorum]MDK2562827.1 hypothetical protein [Romboutsia sedimentorum]
MNNANIGMKDLIKELGITKNKVEFTNDLNLFLNISAFDESQGEYYDIIKSKFDENMGKWNIDINDNFSIISKYIKCRKLPYKIVKDEGFEMIKSEKFVVSMLVELYAMYIVINNDEVSKNEMIKFIHNEFKHSGLNIYEKDIVLNDLEYLFRDKKLTLMCKTNLNNKKIEIKSSLDKTIHAIEKRKNIKLNLNKTISNKSQFEETKNDVQSDLELKNIQLKKSIDKLREEVEINKHIINEYIDKEIVLQNEITKLQKYNIELISYGKEQYSKALVDLVKNMNDDTNGNILDRLYCYSKGEQEKNLMFVATNLFNVFRQMGISPRETKKIGTNVDIGEYSFYNYRLNKDISDIKLSKGDVLYPAWFYNGVEILKPYVNIKGE